ncbi:MAG: hydrogenase maturation nickel metallochaperone HypA [Bacteroidales bacterium]|nr:hydrogenase maturation nickel metallochaperone HypA [Bacteroidales bacterium]
MHELGIVFHIIREVKEVAAENNCAHVSKVVMNIGEVSAIVPYLLTDCWDWAVRKEDLLNGCKLEVNTVPAVTFCETCKREYETVKHGKTCPYCNSGDTYLLRGNEVEIKEIEVSGPDASAQGS